MYKMIKSQIEAFVTNDSGATAIEYSLIGGLIFLVIVTSVQGLGTNMEKTYKKIDVAVEAATN